MGTPLTTVESPVGPPARSSRTITDAPWTRVVLPPEVTAVPTMLGVEELQLLYWLAREYAGPSGGLVDAGCFLGGSSAALLAGLRDRPALWTGPPLRSYDLFRVEEYTVGPFFSEGSPLAVGARFRDRYDANVSRYPVPHVVNEGDIARFPWPGEPIDVLFVDVMKNWDLVGVVHRNFFGHLVPGRSVIVHQDYGYGVGAWIHISVELLWDYLEHLGSLEPSPSHVFRLRTTIPAELLELDLRKLPAEEKLRLMQRAVERWTGYNRGMLEAANAYLLAHLGRRREAEEQLAHVRSTYAEVQVQSCVALTEQLFDMT